MSEKRFTLEQWTEESLYYSDGEYSAHMSIGFICEKVEKKLNEQQEQLDLYKEAILTMLGLLADKGIIFSGVKDE